MVPVRRSGADPSSVTALRVYVYLCIISASLEFDEHIVIVINVNFDYIGWRHYAFIYLIECRMFSGEYRHVFEHVVLNIQNNHISLNGSHQFIILSSEVVPAHCKLSNSHPHSNPLVLLFLCCNFPAVPAVLFLLAGKAAGDTDPDKTALGLRISDAVEPDDLIPIDADHRGLAPLRRFDCVNEEAAGMAPATVIPNHAEVFNPGGEAGLSVDLAHHDAGLTDSEGELGGYLGTDGAVGSCMNPFGNVLYDAHTLLASICASTCWASSRTPSSSPSNVLM
nr:MAG TPA: hypothetical protein [Caudoviricetes sp.]